MDGPGMLAITRAIMLHVRLVGHAVGDAHATGLFRLVKHYSREKQRHGWKQGSLNNGKACMRNIYYQL